MKYHTLFFHKLGKISQNLSSAAVVIGALRVNVNSLLKKRDYILFEEAHICQSLIGEIILQS